MQQAPDPSTDSPAAFPDETIIWDNQACMPLRPDDDSFLTQLARHRDDGRRVSAQEVVP